MDVPFGGGHIRTASGEVMGLDDHREGHVNPLMLEKNHTTAACSLPTEVAY